MMWTFRYLALAVGVIFQLTSVVGYASWMQCYVDLDDSEVMMNQKVLSVEDAPHKVTVEVKPQGSHEWVTNFTYPKDSLTSVEVRLSVPPELQDDDVQFVVETSEGAKFVEPIMCEGRRSFARNHDDAVTLVLEGSTDTVSLKAGWASGYEAVKLTPLLFMQMESSEPVTEPDMAKPNDNDAEEEEL